MEGKGTISDYRGKLDKTLASPDLINDEILQTLVRNQILQSSHLQSEEHVETIVEQRSKEVSNFLSMLRSSSENEVERTKSNDESHGGWKVCRSIDVLICIYMYIWLKHDTEEFRVMYREGPAGTPFHTLLVEGYVDGPLDVCLCISWESGLYTKWWPQTSIPTFKVVSSKCLQRVRHGEQISLVREALIHYFAFEYFQDDLLVVLLNSLSLLCKNKRNLIYSQISDSEKIDRRTHGFTREGIPDAEDVIRIDVIGGFALQKVSADRSYFRTIANMDIKLDFVPPALINFVSRQLIGSGFKLYKKEMVIIFLHDLLQEVASVSKGDEKFLEALKDPLYTCIREALNSRNVNASCMLRDDNDEEVMVLRGRNELNDIEENVVQGSGSVDNCTLISSNYSTDRTMEKLKGRKGEFVVGTKGEEAMKTSTGRKKVPISPKVEQTLETLEKAIYIFREQNKLKLSDPKKEVVEESFSSEAANEMSRKNGSCAEFSRIGSQELNSLGPRISSENHASRHKGSNSYTRETNQNKIVPASLDEDRSSPSNLHSSINQQTRSTVLETATMNYNPSADANSINGNRMPKRKNKRSMFCCFHYISEL
ncbi:hypothetical protein CDL12_19967 [Handroanthus impetiginosus]|uniref:START domain-containing protein n=1 Tax=Handroanthus impetiginosus TaxID=429701 RepID=A0A2G9GQB2_9LAMI|nr:hypothetical protein CDL12_19967 [Handroanthus impetiginosus]